MNIRELLIKLLGIKDKDVPEGDGVEGFSDAQIAEALSLSNTNFAAAREARDIEAATAAVEAMESLALVQADRAEKAKDLDTKFNELESRIVVESDPEPEPEVTPDPEPTPDLEPTPDPVPEVVVPEVVIEPEKVPVAAAVNNVIDITELAKAVAAELKPVTAAVKPIVPKPTNTPAPSPAKPLVTITAAADIKGQSAGADMSVAELADGFVNKAGALTQSRRPGKLDVASLTVEWPTDRFLSEEDSASTNSAKIYKMQEQVQVESRKQLDAILAAGNIDELMTLTAEGGLCAPVNVRYEIFELGTDVRPLRDALLRFGATRGGIQFNAPPVLADVDGSVQITLEADDATGSTYPKDCIRVDCGELSEVRVAAISLCMEVGNFQRLSFPENFRAWWKLGKVSHARTAEDFLWDRMVTLSLALSAATDGLGTARQVLAALARGAQQYRDRFRIGDEAVIRAYVPSWLVVMMQVDFLRQAPGDNAIGITKATISRYLASFGVAATYVLDGQASSSAGYTQLEGALNPWPDEVDIIYTVDGTFLHTDMGSLDFGTEIRDFTQIRNNDSGAFMETFENVARVGPQAGRLRLAGLCSSGLTSGVSDDVDALCASDY